MPSILDVNDFESESEEEEENLISCCCASSERFGDVEEKDSIWQLSSGQRKCLESGLSIEVIL